MGPFLGTEALASGRMTRHDLRTRFELVHRNVYIPRGHVLTTVEKAEAAWLWSRREATLAGLSAAAVLGSRWIDNRLPAELNRRSRDTTAGVIIHSGILAADEITVVRGLPVTTPARTAFDLGRRPGLSSAVARLDALFRASAVDQQEVLQLAARHGRARGLGQLRQALALTDAGAESPQETRLRLELVAAALPTPSTQIDVFDTKGFFVARVDMGWRRWRVGVEYDGTQHWGNSRQRSRDIDRIAELEALKWKVIRVSAEMLRDRVSTVISRTRMALSAAGCPI
ncbi:DUF559 domain-containing protein [Mycobacterium sp. 236(2023)]|uniref:type IV toxin-antitoxin system AbiEi family antitoxin n=1 Tax=Mycobacterium sp. 236(2023) TaxID=3038163 RepID=UPI00241568DE|nr:DUF559 domain-containing protein [Mycobacterium sp. 236(2023)]MDG4665651.1 DUF559 domain-containing protein [Mycobacterium sp. 236(2023)]